MPLTIKTLITHCLAIGILLIAHPATSQASEGQSTETSAALAADVVFSGGTKTPWKLYIGNPNDWMVPVRGDKASTRDKKNVTIQAIKKPSGAITRQVQWTSGTTGQMLWKTKERKDLSALQQAGGALSLVFKVDQAPSKKVSLRMDCGYPCTGSLDMTQLFSSLPNAQWVRVGISLSCFQEAGANLNKIDSPLVLVTKGNFGLTFADVRLDPAPAQESLISCG